MRLFDRMRAVIRTRHYSIRTEDAYIQWVRRFILFHGKKHPSEMGSEEINAYLTHLAVERHVSASTQSQALAAILFLYRDVLGEEVPWLTELVRAPRRERAPVVLTREEVRRLLGGLRSRVKDVDLETGEVMVRPGKGSKDRTTMLPRVLSVGCSGT